MSHQIIVKPAHGHDHVTEGVCKLDSISLEEHKRIYLSPPPDNFTSQSLAALDEAYEKSSRAQSLHSSSTNLYSKPIPKSKRNAQKKRDGERGAVQSLFCCVSSRPRPPKHNELEANTNGYSVKKQPQTLKPVEGPEPEKKVSFLQQLFLGKPKKKPKPGQQPAFPPEHERPDNNNNSNNVNGDYRAPDCSLLPTGEIDDGQGYGLEDPNNHLLEIKQNLLGDIPTHCIGRKCLVLDLDETLVHSSFAPVVRPDFTVKVELEANVHDVYVLKRPFLDVFLNTLKPLYEIVMFTASMRQYADPVCDQIDPNKAFTHRLFRDSCVSFARNFYKDLTVLGRDIQQVCIIDNSPLSFARQLQNAIQVRSWYNDPADDTLLKLIPYLVEMSQAQTVVQFLAEQPIDYKVAIAAPKEINFEYDGDLNVEEESGDEHSHETETDEETRNDMKLMSQEYGNGGHLAINYQQGGHYDVSQATVGGSVVSASTTAPLPGSQAYSRNVAVTPVHLMHQRLPGQQYQMAGGHFITPNVNGNNNNISIEPGTHYSTATPVEVNKPLIVSTGPIMHKSTAFHPSANLNGSAGVQTLNSKRL